MQRYYRLGLPLACLLLILGFACGENDTSGELSSGPCPGESGFGARVTGDDASVDACVSDETVVTVFTNEGWYDVSAHATGTDGTLYEFYLLFPHHSSSRALNVTSNLAAARADADGAWFYYRETPPDGETVESVALTPGPFRLGYSDTDVVAGMFEGIGLVLETADSGEPAGTRTVSEGFFSVLTDSKETLVTH